MTVRVQNRLGRDVAQVSAAAKLGDHEIIDARGNRGWASRRFLEEVQ